MHILHLTPYYAPAYPFGGVVRAVEGMAGALARRGHLVTVLTTDALTPATRTATPEEMIDGVRVVRVPNLVRRGHLNLSTPFGMGRVASSLLNEVDIVHAHEFRTVENLLVTALVRQRGLPLVLSPHGTLTRETGRGLVKAGWDMLLSPAVACRFHAVVGLTQAEADEARALWETLGGHERTRFEVVPNGVNIGMFEQLPGGAAFRARYGLGDAPVCLFLGRLHPRKGAHLLARAFHMASVPGTRLVIAGPDEGARALIEPFIDARVVLTGYLDGAARLEALAAADVFALPAVGEGLSMAVLEALAAGLPVILSPGCNLPEAALSGAGLEVAPTPEALAAALHTLLTDPQQRAVMGAAGRRLVREAFTWDGVAARLEAVYNGIRIETDEDMIP